MANSKDGGGDFRNLVDNFMVGDLDLIRHNETDYETFRQFSSGMDARYEDAQNAKHHEAKKKNLIKWLQQVPTRWRKATFKEFQGDSRITAQIKSMIRKKQKGYFIQGPHTSGKSYLAYAILRVFVQHGLLKPSQIKVITESDLLSLANGGFETRAAFEQVFSPQYKAYFFDSLGSKDRYDEKRENPAIAKLIEEAYNRSAIFIGTSHMSLEYYSEGLTESAAAKLLHMTKDGVVSTGKARDSDED